MNYIVTGMTAGIFTTIIPAQTVTVTTTVANNYNLTGMMFGIRVGILYYNFRKHGRRIEHGNVHG